MAQKYDVVEIEHQDREGADKVVYIWAADGVGEAIDAIQSCLSRGEVISTRVVRMTEKQFDRLDEYEGEC